MARECDDEELRQEAIEQRRAWHRATHCVCGSDLPGRCPGPYFCPYSGLGDDDPAEETV
jgi:hypothetical protein